MAHGEIHIELSVNYANDPKVAALARFGRDARPARALYVDMICYVKANLTDGFVPDEQLGILVYPDLLKAAVRQTGMLAEVGLIEAVAGGWHIKAYLKRNKSRAEVMELSEARAEAGRQGGKRSGLVRGTQAKSKQSVKDVASIGLNTESETESETQTPTPSESPPRGSTGTRLPEPFEISDEMKAWVTAQGITPTQALASTERFCDFWRAKPGKDGRKVDWPATWRNWLRKDHEARGGNTPLTPGQELNRQMGLG
jgi:hypothetical protein